jgi:hypothetical protein
MGRHSIAHIDAQRGAGTFVGRVGALALALGIGTAVAGGAGIAHADDTGGGDAGGAPSSSTASAGSTSTDTATTTGPAKADDGVGVKADEPGDTTPPKMQLGTRTEPAEPGAKSTEKPSDAEEPASLPEFIASIPQRFVDTLTHPAAAPPKKRAKDTDDATSTADTKTDTKADVETDTDDPAPSYTRTLADTATAVSDFVAPKKNSEPAPVTAPVAKLAAAAPTTTVDTGPVFHNPVVTVVSGLLSALGFPPSAGSPGGTPTAPMPIITAVLQLVRREIENITLQLTWPLTTVTGLTNSTPATSATTPSPTDEAVTAYGDIGKWMLKPDGQIADYGGEPYGGRTVYEAVNIIIVDPGAGSPEQARQRLDTAMFWSGFPAQPIHTTGFQGTIDDITYGQMPNLPLFGYSDNLFVFPNDHGRIFGPDPVETSTGYVWSGAFSTEQLGIVHGFLPGHTYVSSNAARNALAMRMILSGRATYGGMVPLDNAYNTETTTTGDHDGYAVVLILK